MRANTKALPFALSMEHLVEASKSLDKLSVLCCGTAREQSPTTRRSRSGRFCFRCFAAAQQDTVSDKMLNGCRREPANTAKAWLHLLR